MSGWPNVPLGNLCQIELGATPPRGSPRYWDEGRTTGNVWLSIADLPTTLNAVVSDSKEYLSNEGAARGKIVKAGTLLVSFKLTLGRLAYAGCDLRTNEAIAALSIKDSKRIEKEYLYWYLTYFDWDKAAEGEDKVKGKTLNKAKLKDLQVLLPPVEEQRRIVAVLDEAFAAIATATANAEKNLANAECLLNAHIDWSLNDFEGERRTEKLLDCFRLKSGDGLTTKQMRPGRYPVYGGNGIAGSHDEANLEGDNVIIGRVGALCGNTRHITQSIWLTDNAFKVTSKQYDFDSGFLARLLNNKNLRALARQTAQPVISNSSLAALELCFPLSVEVQKEIAERISEAEELIVGMRSVLEKKLDLYSDLKQSLLQRAFAGELTATTPDLIPA